MSVRLEQPFKGLSEIRPVLHRSKLGLKEEKHVLLAKRKAEVKADVELVPFIWKSRGWGPIRSFFSDRAG